MLQIGTFLDLIANFFDPRKVFWDIFMIELTQLLK